MLLNLLCWLTVGVIAGLVAGRFVNARGDDPKLGIAAAAAGAVVGGALYGALSAAGVGALNLTSLWAAAVGAGVALVGWHTARRRSRA